MIFFFFTIDYISYMKIFLYMYPDVYNYVLIMSDMGRLTCQVDTTVNSH